VGLLRVRDRETGRFLYTEQLGRRPRETSWAYVRRSVRREAQVREQFECETLQANSRVGAASGEEFLKPYPKYGLVPRADGEAGDRI
jgi:hypothetical protein